jgi:hypothetical protein
VWPQRCATFKSSDLITGRGRDDDDDDDDDMTEEKKDSLSRWALRGLIWKCAFARAMGERHTCLFQHCRYDGYDWLLPGCIADHHDGELLVPNLGCERVACEGMETIQAKVEGIVRALSRAPWRSLAMKNQGRFEQASMYTNANAMHLKDAHG